MAHSSQTDPKTRDESHGFVQLVDGIKSAIRGNYKYLIENLDVTSSDVLDEAFQDRIIELDDKQRISNETSDQSKSRKFLDIILCKQDFAVTTKLLKILQSNEGTTHIHAKLISHRDPHGSVPPVSQAITETETLHTFLQMCVRDRLEYHQNEGKKLKLSDVVDFCRHELDKSGLGHHHTVEENCVLEAVHNVYPQVRVDKWETTKRKKANKGKSRLESTEGTTLTDIEWRVLCKPGTGPRKGKPMTKSIPQTKEDETLPKTVSTCVSRYDDSDEMDPKQIARSSSSVVASWTTDDVCNYLLNNDISRSIVDKFREEEISGDVFEQMTIPEMKQMTAAKFGPLKKVEIAREKLIASKPEQDLEEEVKASDIVPGNETPRRFDTEVNPATKYRKGHCLPEANKHLGDPLKPIMMYVQSDQDMQEEEFKMKSMEFACACMNERTNGTIYFGIDKDRRVSGVAGNQAKWNDALQEAIKGLFYRDDWDRASKCIRSLKFIEVIQEKMGDLLHVLELDIVPTSEICKDDAFFIRQAMCTDGGPRLMRYMSGDLLNVQGKDMSEFMKKKEMISRNRKQRETEWQSRVKKRTENLGGKLKQLLCQGEETMDGDIFPILVTSPMPEGYTEEKKQKSFHFLKDLPWKVVFDFDDGNGLYKYLEETEEQVLKVITVEDFNQSSSKNRHAPERLPAMLQDLKSCSHRPWVFANGYEEIDEPSSDVRNWKKTKSEGFKEAVRFVKNEIPKGRAVVVFLLFSKSHEVMLEAADELIQKFGNQWFTIAETSEVAKEWQDDLLRRHLVDDKKELDARSVIGLPWNHVNDTVVDILKTGREGTCQLPTSNGSLVTLSDHMRNDWIDLEIVGVKHCKPEYISDDPTELQSYSSEAEARFYKGGEVDWWNFYFKDHVLERSCLNSIMESVQDTLSGKNNEEDRVACVRLYHQPGAGGTTTAKQVLWNLKDKYRCAVVKKITNQTCDQITKFHIFDDEKPDPVLLLFDNIDDEKTSELRAELEEKAKQISRQNLDSPCPVFYVFLICMRNTVLPKMKPGSRYFLLKHALEQNEQNWFRNKSAELKKKYEENTKSGVNPKHLISFNIMKENFSKEYIERTVSDLLSEIKSEKEQTLLKYVSLLNAYDVSFQSVPASAFDEIMDTFEHCAPWARPHSGRWELHLSQPLSILLNQVNRKKLGDGHHIRIIHNKLSRAIFTRLSEIPEMKSLHEVTTEFLDSGLFAATYPDSSVEQLLKVTRDVVKKRAKNPQDGLPLKTFAPLIEEINNDPKQGVERAAEILEKVYHFSDDVFVGQQLARLYIKAKNWQQARKYAKDITDKKSDNSYLWDTYGHSYREEIKEKYTECMEKCMSPGEAVEVVDLAFEAIRIFQKEQEVSEVEHTTYANNSGYFQELATVTILFDCLSLVEGFKGNDVLHEVLVQGMRLPPTIRTLFGEEREARLCQLQCGVNKALMRLEDEHLQLRDDMADEYRKSNLRRGKNMLIRYKENLENYYGEDTDEVPSNLSDEEACRYRRRRIFRLASGNTFRAVFELRRKDDALITLRTLKDLVRENMHHDAHCDEFDLMMMLSVNLTRCCINHENKNQIDRQEMARMSKTLYDLRENKENSLEPFLFSAMFNWPHQNSNQKFPISVAELPAILRNWKQAYYKKYPRQREEGKPFKKKETTMFFLGHGEGMNGLAFDKELRIGSGPKRNNEYFWRSPNVLGRLERWTGTLLHDGCEVKIVITQCGNKYTIGIPTSFPITNRGWWNKRVFLVIGFTWAGPKAFDVNITNPAEKHTETPARLPPMTFVNRRDDRPSGPEWLPYNNNLHFLQELSMMQDQIQQINNIKRKPRHHLKHYELQLLHRESQIRRDYDRILHFRRTAVREIHAGF